MQTLTWANLNESERRAVLRRAAGEDAGVASRVATVVERVRTEGDAAVRALTVQFDGYDADPAFVAPEKLEAAAKALDPKLRNALENAIHNLTAFHKAQIPSVTKVETQPGVTCELQWRPIERVGLYIPGGTAPLVSTLLMLAVPAKLAGCATRILCTPPRRDGSVDPAILAAAHLCGMRDVLPIGGAQAVAAMAFGTKTVPKVDKIFGPGNSYVTAAKQQVSMMSGGAAIDMPAGPSEVMVIADSAANPAWIAADLLAQAEHGTDSQSLLLTTDSGLAARVSEAVKEQTARLSRTLCVEGSLNHSRILIVPDMNTALEVSNLYAPEHLILHVENAASFVPMVQHAGSVFVGPWSPETAGDYASGTNHVLPTYGHARAYGSLSLLSFMKSMSVQTLTREGLTGLAPTLVALAEAEGLDAHKAAVTVRQGASHAP